MPVFEHVRPEDIEKTSFSIIAQELSRMGKHIPPELAPLVMRVIHTTADFDYADTLVFSPGVLAAVREAFLSGADIVTDTNMARAGINKQSLARFGGQVHCFMADADVAEEAKARGTTRAAVSMERAAAIGRPLICAVGNAPTALVELCRLIDGGFLPACVIGVPVGFVNVVAAKELLMEKNVPFIVNKGRKGGSAVAAAICNAVLYMIDGSRQ
ncbi:MAG TPA: precorrin-8X methylmutase [Treponema sp.]|nr:precorrin-8X methylmutase [Treponema sp.]